MEQNLVFELAETARVMRRDFDRRASALGSSRAQWRLLAALVREDGRRQVDLAEALDVEPITLCRMVDRLEEAGLVERRRDEHDRRAWRIHLTAKAAPLIAELEGLADGFFREVLAGIDEADVARTRGILARIRDNLGGRQSQARAV